MWHKQHTFSFVVVAAWQPCAVNVSLYRLHICISTCHPIMISPADKSRLHTFTKPLAKRDLQKGDYSFLSIFINCGRKKARPFQSQPLSDLCTGEIAGSVFRTGDVMYMERWISLRIYTPALSPQDKSNWIKVTSHKKLMAFFFPPFGSTAALLKKLFCYEI